MSNSVSTLSTTLNETVVRLVGGFVSLFAIAILVTQSYWISLYLIFDFFFRAFTNIKPPLALLSIFIAEKLNLKPKPIYAPPKKFAAGVGFAFSIAITALLFLNFTTAALLVTSILLVCAVLESIFAICVGCYVYDWVVAPFLNKK